MIKHVFWNKGAVESLQNSYDFICSTNPKSAEEFIDRVDALINMLVIFPDIGRRSAKFKSIRQCRVDKHRKLYYQKKHESLVIIHIQDDRSDPKDN